MKPEAEPLDQPRIEIQKIPHHIAIIMDGNRRWAKKQHLPSVVGHWHGAQSLAKIVEASSSLGIKVLTVYAFSTENWNRTQDEIDSIMELFRMYLVGQKERMIKEGVRLGTIGDLKKLPPHVKETLDNVKKATSGGDKIDLVLAINYGARDDMRRALVSIIEDCQRGSLQKEDVTEGLIGTYLDTAPWGDPQLLIRTSGESRLSNFLLWQISYAEVYITDVLWPDFDEQQLIKAIIEFQKRERRVGC